MNGLLMQSFRVILSQTSLVITDFFGLAPSYLSNLFTKNTERNIDINLRNAANDLYIPRMTTSKGQKAISYRGAKT